MKAALALVFASLGAAIALFAANIAWKGADPAIPGPSASYEGEVLPGTTLRSPVGEPFSYGEIRIQDADNTSTNIGTVHWRGTFGSPNVRIRTRHGEQAVHLPPPARWRILDGTEDSQEVAGLGGLPIVSDVTVDRRISPPFRLTARAIRPGDHILVAKDPSARVRVYVGSRAEHAALRAAHESERWPIVVLLGLMAVISFYVARRVLAGSFFDDVPDDEEPKTAA
jgi:hypothetical protein